MLGQCWPAVYDVGPTLTHHWFNVSCCWVRGSLTLTALKYFEYIMETKDVFFQFEIITNVLASSSSFIWIHVLCVYGHDKYCILCGDRLYTSESDVYWRQILTYKYCPRTERVKTTIRYRFPISNRVTLDLVKLRIVQHHQHVQRSLRAQSREFIVTYQWFSSARYVGNIHW